MNENEETTADAAKANHGDKVVLCRCRLCRGYTIRFGVSSDGSFEDELPLEKIQTARDLAFWLFFFGFSFWWTDNTFKGLLEALDAWCLREKGKTAKEFFGGKRSEKWIHFDNKELPQEMPK